MGHIKPIHARPSITISNMRWDKHLKNAMESSSTGNAPHLQYLSTLSKHHGYVFALWTLFLTHPSPFPQVIDFSVCHWKLVTMNCRVHLRGLNNRAATSLILCLDRLTHLGDEWALCKTGKQCEQTVDTNGKVKLGSGESAQQLFSPQGFTWTRCKYLFWKVFVSERHSKTVPLETEIGTLNFEWHMSQNKSILAEIVTGPCDRLNDLEIICFHCVLTVR